jgi:iron complex outermembrane receptor protein
MNIDRYGIRRTRGRAPALLVALAAALGNPAALAQIEEIVVTARKKEEQLKEVPLAITAFDASAIESAAITNLSDVAALTPGLSFFNPFGENLPVPVIRGVVPQDIFGTGAAAIFVDGVYISGREGLNFNQLDIERIEVVKGPQSALYGRTAFSGAINYVTRKPSEAFEAKSEVEAGNDGKQRILGSISGPLLGDLPLYGRISALYDEWDGSYHNTQPGGDDIGGYRYRSFQGALRWVPADGLEVNLGLYYSNDEIDEAPVAALPANCEDRLELTSAAAADQPFPRFQNFCGRIPDLRALPDALDPSQFPNTVPLHDSVTRDSMPKVAEALGEDRDLARANLTVNWDVGFGTFTFLTGYSDTEQNSASDFNRSTGEGIPFIYCPSADTSGAPPFCTTGEQLRTPMGFYDRENGSTVEEVSQEIRFASPPDERLRFLAGAYYFNVEQTSYPGGLIATTPLPGSIFDIGLGPFARRLAIGSYINGQAVQPDGALDPLTRKAGEQETSSWALFGAVDFDLTDAWELGAELRITREAQESRSFAYKRCAQAVHEPGVSDPGYYPFNNPPVEECGDDFYDLRETRPCVDLRPGDEQIDGDCTLGFLKGSERFKSITGRLSAKYQFDTGWMAYGSVARSVKPGGLTVFRTNVVDLETNSVGPETFVNPWDEEEIIAYELGLKGYTADRRIGIDLALFYNDWTNIVLRQLTERAPDGNRFEQPTGLNVNAGDARVFGWEFATDIVLTDNLRGRLTGAWTDSELTDARQDTFALFPSFYTTDPSCAPEAIQALPVDQQDEKAQQCEAISGDVSGNTQMRQPEWTASASLNYRRPVMGDWDVFWHAQASYQSKLYLGNDNQAWVPSHTYVNLRFGVESPRYTVEFWVNNLFDNDDPVAAFRDIYWTNDDDILGREAVPRSNFDDFPPLRYTVTYPKLRTFGVVGKMRFGALAE